MRAVYDKEADVLYVNLGPPVPVEGDGLPGGVELDFSSADGRPCGVTVIGYVRNLWPRRVRRLAKITSKHLSIDADRARGAIVDAVKEAE